MERITRFAHWEVLPMSLSKKIAAALDENTRAYVMPCTVTVEESPHRVTLHLEALDTVGVAFSSFEFATSGRAEWSSNALNDWGSRLASRITYLMEPLKVLEIDSGGGEVQIRSQSPTTRNAERGYYEMRLFRQGLLRMKRYTFEETTRQRHESHCKLTREVLERLADDIAASLA
jgi:hypothetical protein